MRTIIFIFISLFCASSFAQISNFDDLNGVAGSDQYDYKNPVFDGRLSDLSTSVWFSYERYKANGASDIIVRQTIYSGFLPETVLTSAVNDSNTNPSLYDKLIVWESNKDGNRNIYYSIMTGTNWSAPLMLPGSTLEDETQPNVVNNNTQPASNNYYLLTFKRGADIILKKYSTSLNAWDPAEYNLSDSISENCSLPIIAGRSPQYAVAFIKHVSDGVDKIVLKRFSLTSSTGALTLQNSFELDHNAAQEKMKLSNSFTFSFQSPTLTFTDASDPLFKEVYALNSVNSSETTLLSSIPTGSSSSGKGTTMGIVFNSSQNLPSADFFVSAFGCITNSFVNSDSTVVSLCKHFNTSSSSNEFKHFGVGSQGVTTKLDLSSPVGSGSYFKIWAVWEKQINGKSALIASFMTDFLGSVNYIGAAVKYSLQQNYPNPFNPVTKIEYEIPVSTSVELKVYNALGKEVASLVNQQQTSGKYNVDFNGSNFSSGIYFYTLKAGDFIQTRKMLLIK